MAEFLSKLRLKLIFCQYQQKKEIIFKKLALNFALTNHSVANLAIKIVSQNKTICYSGDGFPLIQAEKLYFGCDLLIHEAFLLNKNFAGHINIKDLLKTAIKNKVKNLALVHLNNNLRQKKFQEVKKLISQSKINVFIPDEKDVFTV